MNHKTKVWRRDCWFYFLKGALPVAAVEAPKLGLPSWAPAAIVIANAGLVALTGKLSNGNPHTKEPVQHAAEVG